MLQRNPTLVWELVLTPPELVALRRFTCSDANWLEVNEATRKEIADGDLEEEEHLKYALPGFFAEIVSEERIENKSGWDETKVRLRLTLGLPTLIPGKNLAVPRKYLMALTKVLDLFPTQMMSQEDS